MPSIRRSFSSSETCETSGGCCTMRRTPSRSRVSFGKARSLVRWRATSAALSISPAERPVGHFLPHPVNIHSVKRAGQERLVSKPTNLTTIRSRAPQHGILASGFGQAILATGHPDARRESPKVPLPRSWVRFVEVVEIEDQIAFRRGVEPEISQVRITADHGLDAGSWQGRKILGHERGRTTQEGIRGRHHAADPDRDQELHTIRMSFLHEIDGIRSVFSGRPAAQVATLDLVSQKTTGPPPFRLRRQCSA